MLTPNSALDTPPERPMTNHTGKRKPATVYRYPVRFTQSQLEVASNLLASTGIPNLSTLVHVALAQLAKTSLGSPLGSPQEPAKETAEPRTTDSDPELDGDF